MNDALWQNVGEKKLKNVRNATKRKNV